MGTLTARAGRGIEPNVTYLSGRGDCQAGTIALLKSA
jgi:hypothetical protein